MNRRFLILSAAAAASSFLAACGQGAPKEQFASPVNAEERYALAASAAGFTVGQAMAASTTYVFFDSQCPHCATLWKNSQPLLGKARMVWIPVGLLNAASTTQGAHILGTPDPAATMREHEALMESKRGGVSVPLSGVEAKFRDSVTRNTEIFKALGAESIPFVVYRNASTGQVGVQPGAVTTEVLASLLGL